jgi:hypothetical protein
MPHLLSYMRDNGSLLSNDHTILISHTGGGFVTALTGLYPDRHGITVSNSYSWFDNHGTAVISPFFPTAFKYRTDLNTPPVDPLPNMVTDGGKNTPAPWVPFTRAGCDVGGIGFANIEPERPRTKHSSGPTTRPLRISSTTCRRTASRGATACSCSAWMRAITFRVGPPPITPGHTLLAT